MSENISPLLRQKLEQPSVNVFAGIDLTRKRFNVPRYANLLEVVNAMGLNTYMKPVIFELAEPKELNEALAALKNRELQVEHTIKLPTITAISTWAPDKNIYEISALDSVEMAHYNNLKYLHRYRPFMVVDSLVEKMTGEKSKRTDITARFEGRKRLGDMPSAAIFDALGAKDAWNEGHTGDGQHGVTIDSGFSSNRMLTRTEVQRLSVRGLDLGDGLGHGSFVLNLFRGNPITLSTGQELRGITQCQATSIKALFAGRGRDAGILKALEMAISLQPDGINLSLGGVAAGPPEESLLARTCKQIADEEKILIYVSAGNDEGPINEPANEPAVITVGSCSLIRYQKTGEVIRSFYSSFGTPLDCVAFGGGQPAEDDEPKENIVNGTAPSSLIDNIDLLPNAVGSGVGTSWSCPEAWGIGMLWRQKYLVKTGALLTNADVHNILDKFGTYCNDQVGKGLHHWGLITDFI